MKGIKQPQRLSDVHSLEKMVEWKGKKRTRREKSGKLAGSVALQGWRNEGMEKKGK